MVHKTPKRGTPGHGTQGRFIPGYNGVRKTGRREPKPLPSEREQFTIPDLVSKYGRSYWWWQDFIKRGEIASYKFGRTGKIYVSQSAIDEFFARHLRPARKGTKVA